MKYKLLVLDLDGTLTNAKKEITENTRQTLIEAHWHPDALLTELLRSPTNWNCRNTKAISWPITAVKSSTGKPAN